MSDEQARIRILEMIENGQITAEEGLKLLESLSAGDDEAEAMIEEGLVNTAAIPLGPSAAPGVDGQLPPEAPFFAGTAAPQAEEAAPQDGSPDAGPEVYQPKRSEFPPNLKKWRYWWMIPLWVGVGITVFGALLMFLALQAVGVGFWFCFAGLPFILGVAAIALAWASRNAPWLHLRVTQKPGERPQHIAISFPLPLRSSTWFLRTFGNRIHGINDQNLDQVILAANSNLSPENPVYIEINDDEDGERVELYIG